jgi:hypothetical protein
MGKGESIYPNMLQPSGGSQRLQKPADEQLAAVPGAAADPMEA